MTALKIAATNDGATPTAEIYTVTPAVAKRWLSRNVRNRPIREKIVNAYARDMSAGRWQITGEAIKFDTNGALSDGQHRLSAVVKSKVSVPMLIVRGVAPDAQAVMDSGVKRSTSDSLTLDGVSDAPIVVAISRLALKFPELGYVIASEATGNSTNSEILEFIADHPEIHRAAEWARRFYAGIDIGPSILGASYMRLAEIDLGAAVEFFTSISDMRTDGPGDPRLALVRRLTHMRRDGVRRSADMELSLVLRTWNKWRRNETATSLPMKAQIPSRLA